MSLMTDELAFAAARATADAAFAAARWVGRGDEKEADQAAVTGLARALMRLPARGRVVIGEGERGEYTELFVGEEVGAGNGPELDIAVDPLEGATLAAKAMANALSIMVLAPRGGMLRAPDIYMEKLAIGPGFEAGLVDLDKPADQNVKALASAKGVKPEEIGVCVLDRPRHAGVIEALRSVGARVHLIPDGDIAGVIHCTKPETGVDMYVGLGGAQEGVLAAAALRCVDGQFQARLVCRTDEERGRAERAGIDDLKRRYTRDELVSADVIFIATGVTGGTLLDGVRTVANWSHAHTLIMNSATRTVSEWRVKQPAS